MAEQPVPTREQFNAAVAKVTDTAPEGTTRDQFYELVDRELRSSTTPYKPMNVLAEGMKSAATSGDAEGATDPGWLTRLKGALEGAAHPQSLGDVMSLLIPGGASNVTAKGIAAPIRGVGKTLETVGETLKPASIPVAIADAAMRGKILEAAGVAVGPSVAIRLGRGMQNMADAIHTPHPSIPFNEMPLAQQMERLPFDRPAPVTSRTSMPPVQAAPAEATSMTELPVWKQQEMMDAAGSQAQTTSGSHRMGDPPFQPSELPRPSTLSPVEREALAKKGYSQQLIDRIEQSLKEPEVTAETMRPVSSHEPIAPRPEPVAPPPPEPNVRYTGAQEGAWARDVEERVLGRDMETGVDTRHPTRGAIQIRGQVEKGAGAPELRRAELKSYPALEDIPSNGAVRLGVSPEAEPIRPMPSHTPSAPSPAVRVGVTQAESPIVAKIKELSGTHGAEEVGRLLKEEPELKGLSPIERTNYVRKMRGGEAGALPPGARATIDKAMEGMSPAEQQGYLRQARNAAAYNYIQSRIGGQ